MHLMFGGDLSLGIETGVFDGVFGSYWAGIRRLGKKIKCRKFLGFLMKVGKLMGTYLFIKSMNPYRITSERIIKQFRPILPCQVFSKRTSFSVFDQNNLKVLLF
jgi:hypothetical protein